MLRRLLTACVPVTAQQLATWVASLEQKLLASPRQAAPQLLPAAAPGPAAYLANAGAPTYQKPAAYLANKAAPTYHKPSAYLLNAAAPTTAVAGSVASSVAGSVASAGIATARSPAGIAAAATAAERKSVPPAPASGMLPIGSPSLVSPSSGGGEVRPRSAALKRFQSSPHHPSHRQTAPSPFAYTPN